MVSEVFAGLSALKAAFDIAKGLKDIDDVTRRNAAIIELQEKLLIAYAAQFDLNELVRKLKEEVARFETWDAEKQRYELKQLASGGAAFAYAVKPAMQGAEPFHCICASCYQRGIKSLLQLVRRAAVGPREQIVACPVCSAEVHASEWPPVAL